MNKWEEMVDQARADAAKELRDIKEEAQRTADREAKKILALSIQRMAADQTAETTVSVVELPSDEMKGRIIGREGRNIRTLETLTGVDIIIGPGTEAIAGEGRILTAGGIDDLDLRVRVHAPDGFDLLRKGIVDGRLGGDRCGFGLRIRG